MDMGGETVKTRGCKLLLDVFHYVGISKYNGIPNSIGTFKLRSEVKYNVYDQIIIFYIYIYIKAIYLPSFLWLWSVSLLDDHSVHNEITI